MLLIHLAALAILVLQAQPLEIQRRIPHSGYSEGLDFHEGFLWHALPKSILKIDPRDGRILERFTPPSDYSESLSWFKGKLWNLSFSNNGIYAGKIENKILKFELLGSTPEIHGWGITHDGVHLIITGNYSTKLYFLNPNTLKTVKTLTASVGDLEDLAWDGVGIWSSSFTTHKGSVFRVDPTSGAISDLFTLPNVAECPIIDGIAYDGKGLWITGKECASIYYAKKPTERLLAVKKAQ